MEVFISYRRLDGNLQALLVHKELEQRLPGHDIFMDVADIGWGDDFVHAIDARMARADVVIMIIGKRWLEMLQARERGDDWVRHEVTTALRLRAAALAAGVGALGVLGYAQHRVPYCATKVNSLSPIRTRSPVTRAPARR